MHFPRGERHDRFGLRQKLGRKVAPTLGLEYYSLLKCWPGPGPRNLYPPGQGALGSGLSFNLLGLLAVLANRGGSVIRDSPLLILGSVANRSVSHPTRLETRTKESNMCASHGVLRNLKAQ